MDLPELRRFVVLAEELHFGRAAARLNLSAPPLTQHIKKLEQRLGAQLFNRTKRSVRLTAAGEALLLEARKLLAQAAGLSLAVQQAAEGHTGQLHIGFGSATASAIAFEMQTIHQQLKSVNIVWHELSSSEQVDGLLRGQLDIGFLTSPLAHENLSSRVIIEEPIVAVVAAGHPCANKNSLTLGALRGAQLIIPPRELSPSYHDGLVAACEQAGFRPETSQQVRHLMAILALVAIGAGISLLPRSVSKMGIPGVSFVAVEGLPLKTCITAAWHSDRISPTLMRVLDVLQSR